MFKSSGFLEADRDTLCTISKTSEPEVKLDWGWLNAILAAQGPAHIRYTKRCLTDIIMAP